MDPELATTPGPHVFVASLDVPMLEPDDDHHLRRSLRLRTGDPLTISDGRGAWRTARLGRSEVLEATGPIHVERSRTADTTIAFSLVKGQRPELAVQKLTELGVGHIVMLRAERSVVRWDDDKIAAASERLIRIVREAAMQSHRTELPTFELLPDARDWLRATGAAIADFGGPTVAASTGAIAVGPEGGWTEVERSAASATVGLGPTVLRAETAAIAAGVLLCEAKRTQKSDGS